MSVWRRRKDVVGAAVASLTATFDEGTAPDSTKTLVAVVGASSGTPTAPSGWTTAGALFLGSSPLSVFTKQGDGTTNSFTTDFGASPTSSVVTLYAFDGYVSLTPDTTFNATLATGTSATVGPTTGTTATNTIAIAAVLINGTGGSAGSNWGAFTDGFEGVNRDLQIRMNTGAKALTASGSTPSTSTSWVNSRTARTLMVVLQGTSAESGGDTTPPSVPAGLAYSNLASDGFDVTWTASTDAVGVVGYRVLLNGTINGTTPIPSYTFADLDPSTAYSVTVQAYDAANNYSAASSALAVTTPATPAPTVKPLMYNDTIPTFGLNDAPPLRIYYNDQLMWGDPYVTEPVDGSGALYGPTGTNEFALAAPTATHDVAPTWTAIGTQITTCQGHAGVCRINVTPGTLPDGNGFASGSTGVLQNLGSTTKKILVRPRDSYGSVKVASGTSGISFVNIAGVYIDRIDMSACPGVMLRNSRTAGIGHTKINRFLSTANGSSGVDDLEFVEVVFGPTMATAVEYDRSEYKTSSGYTMNNVKLRGCYVAPNWKPNGSSAHNDSIQIEAVNGGGAMTNFHYDKTILFRSADQGIQSANTSGGVWTNSAFFGTDVTYLRYPLYPGGDPPTLDNTLNGTWSNIQASNCVVGGSIGSNYTFTSSVNNRCSVARAGWTTDTSLATMTLAQLDTIAPYPTDARLATIWAG